MCGCNGDMPPRWGLEWLWDGDGYKHVAPLGLTQVQPRRAKFSPASAKLEAEILGMKELEEMLR